MKYSLEFVPVSLLRLQIEACTETENSENFRKGEGMSINDVMQI